MMTQTTTLICYCKKLYGKMMKSLFSVSISSQREKLHGMVILTTCIPIQIQQSKHYHGLKNLELKQIVEKLTETKFNSCLLNLYHIGNEGMGWHSDDEESIQPNSTIASLSLGAERKFSFKHKQTKQTISSVLEHGSAYNEKCCACANILAT